MTAPGPRRRPQVIGLLGGMSWQSTLAYYRLANELVQQLLGGLHSARIVLSSLDFADIESLQVADRWEDAGELLAQAARSVEAAGADLLLLCTNTLHRGVINRLVAAGAEGITLGCTEIELLVGPADSPVPVLPTARLHVQAAVDAARAGSAPH